MIVAAVLLLAELAFGIIERGIGRYLVWQNVGRQKIGRSWEAAQSRLLASTRVDSAQHEIRQRTGNLAALTDFDLLLQYLRANEQVLVPLSQFVAIYRGVPEIFQPLLVPPEVFLTLVRDRQVSGALCAFGQSTLNVFLVDAQDRAMYQAVLSDEQLQMIAKHGGEQRLDASVAARFASRIFSDEVFYDGLERLPAEQRAWLLRTLPILTEPESRFVRFAVADQMAAGFVEVAFALDAARSRIYYLPEEWLIEYLLPALHENRFEPFE